MLAYVFHGAACQLDRDIGLNQPFEVRGTDADTHLDWMPSGGRALLARAKLELLRSVD